MLFLHLGLGIPCLLKKSYDNILGLNLQNDEAQWKGLVPYKDPIKICRGGQEWYMMVFCFCGNEKGEKHYLACSE